MTKTNRSPMMRIASVMLVLCMALSCVLCGTMAKYISDVDYSDSATVAKWEFTLNDQDITDGTADTIVFNLFDSTTDNHTVNDSGNVDAEADVETGKSLIAPGTAGSFDLTVKNTSQVNAKYTFELTETPSDHGIFIQYALTEKGGTPTEWYDDFTAINTELMTNDNAEDGNDIAMLTGEEDYTIHWRWVYEAEGADPAAHIGQDDEADTALGVAAQDAATLPTVEIAIQLIAWQVD